MRSQSFPILILVCAALLGPTVVHAAPPVPQTVTFTARLDSGGVPLNGGIDMQFALWTAPTGGAPVWGESVDGVEVLDGVVDMDLGTVGALTGIFTGAPLYLEVQVDGYTLAPRTPIGSVPYAQRTASAVDTDKLGGLPASAFLHTGATLLCSGQDKVTGIDAATGNVLCGTDGGGQVYSAGNGLELVSNQFGLRNLGVLTAHIANGAVTTAKLATGAVGSAQIADGSVAAVDIANNAIGSAHIQDLSVGNGDLGINSIDGTKIIDASIGELDLGPDSVGPSEIQTDAVGSSEIAADAVGPSEIAANAVGMSESNPVDGTAASAEVLLVNHDNFILPSAPVTISGAGHCMIIATARTINTESDHVTRGELRAAFEDVTAGSGPVGIPDAVPAIIKNDYFGATGTAAGLFLTPIVGHQYKFGCHLDMEYSGYLQDYPESAWACRVTFMCQ